jgi:hypothetical protein
MEIANCTAALGLFKKVTAEAGRVEAVWAAASPTRAKTFSNMMNELRSKILGDYRKKWNVHHFILRPSSRTNFTIAVSPGWDDILLPSAWSTIQSLPPSS